MQIAQPRRRKEDYSYLHNIVSLVDVLREDSGGEAVLRVVGALDHLVHLRELQDLLHGTEDLERCRLNFIVCRTT